MTPTIPDLRPASTPPVVEGGLVFVQDEPMYRITNVDAMPPFFMSLVSDSDL